MSELSDLPEDSREGGVHRPAAELGDAIAAGLIGRGPLVERLLIALLTGGHVLIEGPPGVGKTRAVLRLSDGIEATFARIQCTPDLMPADLTGTQVFRPERAEMEFLRGPLFHDLVLVDEINRAPPKVQSALLEAMAERQVTAGGITHALSETFMVAATQNSIEHEGTFPLPEAQLDRFLFHVLLDLPDAETEGRILDLVEGEIAACPAPLSAHLRGDDVARLRRAVTQVHLSRALKDYILRLVMATRETMPDRVEHAVSPRGTLALAAAVRGRAFLQGRRYALPEDVEALAPDVMAHRIIPTWRATADGDTPRRIVADVLTSVAPL